jgi:hypothetical protein
MHGIGDFLPGLQLLFAVQTGYVGIALPLAADGRASLISRPAEARWT